MKDDQLSEAHRRQANKKLASGGLKLNDALASYNISLRFARIPDLPASGAVRDESKDRKYPEELLKDFLRQAGILRSPNDKNENEDNSDDATTASFVPEDGSSEATSDVEEGTCTNSRYELLFSPGLEIIVALAMKDILAVSILI